MYIKVRFVIIIIAFQFLSLNCSNNQQCNSVGSFVDTIFAQKDSVKFTNLFEFQNGRVHYMLLYDSVLILSNWTKSAERFLFNYSLADNRLSRGYVSKGRGPGEVFGVMNTCIVDNQLWIYDFVSKKIMSVGIDDVVNNRPLVFNEFLLKSNQYMISVEDSLHYFGLGNFETSYRIQKKRIGSDDLVNEYGKYNNIPKTVPLISYKNAHQSFFIKKSDGNKIAIAYRFTDIVEILDLNSDSIMSIQSADGFSVDYQASGDIATFTEKTRRAYVNFNATNQFIYLSFSGDLLDNRNSNFGKEIHVYDWNGTPVRKLLFDDEIGGFVVSNDDLFLYAFNENTGFVMVAGI